MNYIVFDLEYNQPYRIDKLLSQEIIEIGAVKLDASYSIVDTFRIFIKPKTNKIMHPRVSRITNITQADLEYAFPLEQSIKHFQQWIAEDCVFCSWGRDDIAELKRNCDFYNLDVQWNGGYIDLQYLYADKMGLDTNQRAGLKSAIDVLDIKGDDETHRALNDAMYTAQVMQKLNIEDINRYLIDFNSASIYTLNTISSLNDERINRQKLKQKCPKCGRFIAVIHNWVYNANVFSSVGRCNRCQEYVICNTSIKEQSDKTLKYKLKRSIITDNTYKSLKDIFVKIS